MIYSKYTFVDGDGAVGSALETISYGYTDTAWKDKLTSYNGAAIAYDEIGNPLTDGTWNYTWAQGRKLQQISKTGTTASYKYNDSGIRTEKTVNGVTTVYNVVGGFVTWEKTGSNNPIYYSYDASGSLWGMQYNGSMYFNVRNAQGDIIRLINSSGTVVVEYAYDAWGNLMSTTGSLAGTLGVDNPYRYRGYRFDTETGLYYLQSRYYNPQWGRFVNADGLIGTANGVGNHNIFAFCHNNAIMFSDDIGSIPSYNVMLSDGSGIHGFFTYMTPTNCKDYYGANDKCIIFNTDEKVVLNAKILSFYKGRLVVKVPIGANAASFGVMFIGNKVHERTDAIQTIQHEYGHTIQYKKLGIVKYAQYVACPSLVCNILDRSDLLPYDYYSSPWEYQADLYGGVYRNSYESWADSVNEFYSSILGLK